MILGEVRSILADMEYIQRLLQSKKFLLGKKGIQFDWLHNVLLDRRDNQLYLSRSRILLGMGYIQWLLC